MNNAIFVTATGTDVGKTYVSGLILKYMREQGINAGYYKPALSGAYYNGNELIPGDAEHVCFTAGLTVPPQSIVSYIFETAVSPHLAAVLENNTIKADVIKKDFEILRSKYDFILAEGCGGIICPLNMEKEKLMLSDIIKLLGTDIIIVASAELGTINQTVLTVEYARSQDIGIKGIILNRYDKSNIMHRDNKKRIEELTGIPILACVENGGTEFIK